MDDEKVYKGNRYMICYVIDYRAGENWIPGIPYFKQDLSKHVDYMAYLHQAGLMLIGGPYTNETSGGMTILMVNSMKEAEEILRNDPAIINGVYSATIKEWSIVRENTAKAGF